MPQTDTGNFPEEVVPLALVSCCGSTVCTGINAVFPLVSGQLTCNFLCRGWVFDYLEDDCGFLLFVLGCRFVNGNLAVAPAVANCIVEGRVGESLFPVSAAPQGAESSRLPGA